LEYIFRHKKGGRERLGGSGRFELKNTKKITAFPLKVLDTFWHLNDKIMIRKFTALEKNATLTRRKEISMRLSQHQ